MKNISLLIGLLMTTTLFAQQIIEPCKFGQPLLDALQSDYTPSNPLGYGPARDILYSEIDNDGLELSGIYTAFTVTLVAGEDPSMSAFQNGAGLNAEHVYPQSLGASEEPMKSDLHNIFPSRVNVNSDRGSCPFGEVTDSDAEAWYYLSMQLSSIPSMDIDLYSEKDDEDCVFEPRESVKGNIARAVFYFYGIYQTTAESINTSFFQNQKDVLYLWHQQDPADATEIRRDSLIALQQGNNNPFIVDSTLVRRAYFEADATYPEGDPNCYSLSTSIQDLTAKDWVKIVGNFVQESIQITSSKNKGTISIFDTQGKLLQQAPLANVTEMAVNTLPQGIYVLHVRSEGLVQVFRFFKQ